MPSSNHIKTKNLSNAEIIRRVDFTDDLFKLWIDTEIPFTFKPGQYITIGSNNIERPYSIASAPEENLLELFIEYIPPEHGGNLTPYLWNHQVGDRLTIRPRAKGIFTFEPKYINHVMISTVTGVAPYVSILRQYILDGLNDHKFFIMDGASYMNEFVYDDELNEMQKSFPDNITFIPSVSRPSEKQNHSWAGATGRINSLVEQYLSKWQLNKDDTLIYTCGHPQMIEDIKTRMAPIGWNVKEERFWKEDDA